MEPKKGKIAVVGDKNNILPFRLIGADSFEIQNIEEAEDTLKRLVEESRSVIFIDEKWASKIPDTFSILRAKSMSAISLIPSASKENQGFARELLRKDIIKALGADINFNA